MTLSNNNCTFTALAPSNIAFVKYWGKTGIQLPINPSLSMTLKNSFTKSKWSIETETEFSLEVYLDGERKTSFESKIKDWFERLDDRFDILKSSKSIIHTSNTFPHSTGIASSASAFASLSKCLGSILKEIKGISLTKEDMSSIARLGSGSASRSLEGPLVSWGDKSLEFASKIDNYDPVFLELCDAVCIVSDKPKSFSSTLGHKLMNEHRFKEARVEQANENYNSLIDSIKKGDIKNFGEVLEDEAMTLHALMMTSKPSYTLLEPNSIEIIKKVRDFREKNQTSLYFTIDAGPNLHLIYFKEDKNYIESFINSEIRPLCCSDIIFDEVGDGAKIINE